MVLATVLAPVGAASILHVDPRSPQDGPGQTWDTAFHFPTDALAAAAVGDEIRIARGTYRPDQSRAVPGGSNSRSATLLIAVELTLAGGYAGFGEVHPDARDFNRFETTLSGDIGVLGNAGDNAYHVITAEPAAASYVLDGVTIRHGNANGPFPHDAGGGLYTRSPSSLARSCTFEANAAASGGAIAVAAGRLVLQTCRLVENTALFGGGVDLQHDALTARECTFERNVAEHYGGAIFGQPAIECDLVSCAFSANRAIVAEGGAVSILTHLPVRMTGCSFFGNASGSRGGALSIGTIGELPVANCLFSGNRSEYGGAVTLFFQSAATPSFTGCTFAGNTASQEAGGVLLLGGGGTAGFANSIFWGNRHDGATEADAIHMAGGVEASVTFSCIEDEDAGDEAIPFGGKTNANIDDPPTFADADGGDGVAGTVDDDLRLLNGSPCIDAANTQATPLDWHDLDDDGDVRERVPFDLDGKPRFVNDPASPNTGNPDPQYGTRMVDMGAYEARAIADLDEDGDVDLIDHQIFVGCMGGPDVTDRPPGCRTSNAKPADFDGDGDVDAADFATLTAQFGGSL
ncbi:MAG: hypothetical protein IT449_07685 [Phycisphaerales bacterium]|nr:hypothetical protein [Phycisphaerales bacterium]